MSDVTRDFNLRTHFIFEFFDVKNKQLRLIKLLLHFFLCNNNNNKIIIMMMMMMMMAKVTGIYIKEIPFLSFSPVIQLHCYLLGSLIGKSQSSLRETTFV